MSEGLNNAQRKALWVAALRSGEYKQTRGQLRQDTTNQMCCLGVACDVALKNEIYEGEWREDGYFLHSPDDDECIHDHAVLPPRELLRLFLINENSDHEDPMVPIDVLTQYQKERFADFEGKKVEDLNGKVFISGLNDCGFTFDEIADIIEKHL